jgi:hypothetical protein
MRALDVIEIADGQRRQPGTIATELTTRALWELPAEGHPFPLPPVRGTRPFLAVKPHRAMSNDLPKTVANLEEVRLHPNPAGPRRAANPGQRYPRWHCSGPFGLHELPLVGFTLLGQAAAGLAVVALFTESPSRPVFGAIGALILAATLLSLLHLGSGSRAWRTSANLKRSALSQEIVALGAFSAAWVIAALAPVAGRIALALAGIALVYCMAEVYRIDAVPRWTTWRTRAAFGSSALLLGILVYLGIRWFAPEPVPGWLVAVAGPALIAQQICSRRRFYQSLHAKAM